MRHVAAEVGIAVVTVPARDTSKHCPRCLTPLRHRKAPDRPTTAGWKWALRPSCGWQGDRDQGAWKRIAARGLTHQSKAVTNRTSGAMAIRTVVDKLETGAVITPTPKTGWDRSKTRPTQHKPTRPTPVRRPSDAGHPPQHDPTVVPASVGRDTLTRTGPRRPAADRYQGVTTISTPTNRHRPRGAALGAGFHLHAHATAPRWEHILKPDTTDTGSLS
ncbi:zinc ribbon domain-containing protein [Kitasatospora sp. GAS204A]|nr:zinc ribbon domain-containing protein [Kitasatospora sp. GAS204B]